MTRRTWMLIGGALLLAVGLFIALVDVNIPSRPMGEVSEIAKLRDRKDLNVVFFLVDTLRADHLSAYGYERPTSPTLADIAASGIRFANVESQSTWTKCSMASLWTGLFPHHTGVRRFNQVLSEAARTPAEIFKEAGFTTLGLWRNGWVSPSFGFAQGFDQYLSPPVHEGQPGGFQPGAEMLVGSDADITQTAAEFFKAHQRERFLFYAHLMDVHQYAYDDNAAALGFGGSLLDSYDSSIHWVDSNIDQMLGELNRLGLLEKTIVVVAADHGEAFREHRREGHARDLYREVVTVPLIVMLPFRLEEPVVVEPLVRNVDIWPTILDLVGLPPLQKPDGVSLVPLMMGTGDKASPVPASVSFIDQAWGDTKKEPLPLFAMTDGDRRVIFRPKEPAKGLEVYDRSSDPKEQKNLASDPPEWAAEMRDRLEQMSREEPAFDVSETNVEEMQRQQLRALGYVGS